MNISLETVLPYLSFLAVSFLCYLCTGVAKGAVWTADNMQKGKKLWWFFWWGRKSVPMHPVVAGAVIGAILNAVGGVPQPSWVSGTTGTIFYYGTAGMLSTWIFDVIKAFARRYGIVLKDPLLSTDPAHDKDTGEPAPLPEGVPQLPLPDLKALEDAKVEEEVRESQTNGLDVPTEEMDPTEK